MNSISASELKSRMSSGEIFQLVDVREPAEHDEFNIGGILMPLSEVISRIDEIDLSKPVVFYCRKGIRSAIAIQRILQKKEFSNLYNLSGGLVSWDIPEKR